MGEFSHLDKIGHKRRGKEMKSDKKNRAIWVRIVVLAIFIMFPVSASAVPKVINYQGYLTDAGRNPLNGTYMMRFVLYDPTGDPVWSEEQSVVVTDGMYGIQLGSVTPLTEDLFEADEAYLGVEIYNSETESWESFVPRQRFTSTAYAFKAENARALEGFASKDFAPVAHEHSGSDITSGIVDEARIDPVIARDSEVTAAVDAHASRTDNPHSTTAAQVGAVAVDQANSVTSGMIVDGQVGAGDINTGQVQRRITGSCGPDSSIRAINVDGTVSCEPDDVGSFSGWGLTGNAGTNPSTNFIGTTDNEALAFRVNNQVAMRIFHHFASPNLIGGYPANSVTAGVYGATIGGGGTIDDYNSVTDHYGTVGGGFGNQAGNDTGTLDDSGGATVGGGFRNTAYGEDSTVGGGSYDAATGSWATVGGGHNNLASGDSSTVPGGTRNVAQGDYSFAAGRRAKAQNQGCFVWADSTDADLNCTNTNRFLTRAAGGYKLFTDSSMSTFAWLAPGASTWSELSDRNVKENYLPTDGKKILISLASIPITTWNYKSQDPSIRHMGPVAQDFSAAFGLGESDKHINTIDVDGVALAAIQGLYKLVQEKEGRISTLEERNLKLQARLAALEGLVQIMAKEKKGGEQ